MGEETVVVACHIRSYVGAADEQSTSIADKTGCVLRQTGGEYFSLHKAVAISLFQTEDDVHELIAAVVEDHTFGSHRRAAADVDSSLAGFDDIACVASRPVHAVAGDDHAFQLCRTVSESAIALAPHSFFIVTQLSATESRHFLHGYARVAVQVESLQAVVLERQRSR